MLRLILTRVLRRLFKVQSYYTLLMKSLMIWAELTGVAEDRALGIGAGGELETYESDADVDLKETRVERFRTNRKERQSGYPAGSLRLGYGNAFQALSRGS